MQGKHEGFSRGSVGFPSVLLAAGWIGLLALWPEMKAPSSGTAVRMEPRVRYVPGVAEHDGGYRDPTMVAFQPAVGLGVARGKEGLVAVRMHRLPRPVRFLDAEPPHALRRTADAMLEEAGEQLADGQKGYRPEWPEQRVFSGAAFGNGEVHLKPDTCLAERGFEVAGLSLAAAAWGDTPWQASLHVMVGEDGRTEHVFLESGTGQPHVDAAVVRMMYRGRVQKPGPACEGRVVIGFKRP